MICIKFTDILLNSDIKLVPKAGLEPARIATVDFESTASTDFATSAWAYR